MEFNLLVHLMIEIKLNKLKKTEILRYFKSNIKIIKKIMIIVKPQQ
jgi:hypothetical protein